MALRTQLVVLAVAIVSPLIYERAQVFQLFNLNHPSRLSKINELHESKIIFQDRLRNCEDVLQLKDEGLAILACDAGRERWNTVLGVFHDGVVPSAELFAYRYKDYDGSSADTLNLIKLIDFAAENNFHTLGIAYDKATSTLFVTNHAVARPRIERFRLDLTNPTAVHLGTIQHTLIHAPNAIALLGSDEFYVTNDHRFTARHWPTLSLLETYLAPSLGTVVHVKLHGDQVQAHVVAHVAFANGVEVLKHTTVAVASTSKAAVYLYTRSPADSSLKFIRQIRLPFLPDNLSLNGTNLLIAGHTHGPLLTSFASSRHVCNNEAELAKAPTSVKLGCLEKAAPSWVSEWSDTDGLRHLYVGTEYPSSATVVWDANNRNGLVAGLYAKGILVWKQAEL